MKKFRDKRKFNDVVTTIERAQKDVDNVLKAARLERYPRVQLSGEQIIMLAAMFLGTIAFMSFFIALFYFGSK